MARHAVTVGRVESQRAREAVLRVIEEVYRNEKGWLADFRREIPADAGERRARGCVSRPLRVGGRTLPLSP